MRLGSHSRPMQCGAMSAHCVSVKVMRIKVTSHLATLNHCEVEMGVLKRLQALMVPAVRSLFWLTA